MAISQFAVEAANKQAVMENTWGHLAPERNIAYPGFMIFTLGAWGDYLPIQAEFKGLSDSPWFFDDMLEFIEKRAKKEGTVYRFDGTYRNHRFFGRTRKISLR